MILDFDLDFLEAAAAIVDTRLERLDKEAHATSDPDAFGIFHQIEYITGFGFVACQTYATAVVKGTKVCEARSSRTRSEAQNRSIHGPSDKCCRQSLETQS